MMFPQKCRLEPATHKPLIGTLGKEEARNDRLYDLAFKLINLAITHLDLRGTEDYTEYYTIASGPTNEPYKMINESVKPKHRPTRTSNASEEMNFD